MSKYGTTAFHRQVKIGSSVLVRGSVARVIDYDQAGVQVEHQGGHQCRVSWPYIKKTRSQQPAPS